MVQLAQPTQSAMNQSMQEDSELLSSLLGFALLTLCSFSGFTGTCSLGFSLLTFPLSLFGFFLLAARSLLSFLALPLGFLCLLLLFFSISLGLGSSFLRLLGLLLSCGDFLAVVTVAEGIIEIVEEVTLAAFCGQLSGHLSGKLR